MVGEDSQEAGLLVLDDSHLFINLPHVLSIYTHTSLESRASLMAGASRDRGVLKSCARTNSETLRHTGHLSVVYFSWG